MTKELIQAAGSAYFADRNNRNLQKLYDLINPVILKISNAILKDDELSKDNLSKVMLKIVNNPNFVFDQEKSFLSFVYNTSKNSAIILYNQRKGRKEWSECDLKLEGAEDIENPLDYIAFDEQESLRLMDHDEIKLEEEDPFHLDLDRQYNRVYDMVAELTNSPEDCELMRDVMFGGFGPKEIKDHYGINSRITVSSRKTRLQWKIKENLRLEFNGSKFQQRDLEMGDFLLRYKTGDIKMTGTCVDFKLNGLITMYLPHGIKYQEIQFVKGVRQGEFREYFPICKVACIRDMNTSHGENITGEIANFRMIANGVEGIPTREAIAALCKKHKTGTWDGQIMTIDGVQLKPTKDLMEGFFNIISLVKRTGKYDGETKTGIWKTFYETGVVSEKYCHDSTYFEIYTEAGEMEAENGCGFLKANVTPHRVYHSNGNLKVEGWMLDNKKVGIWRRFNESGILEEEADYVEKKFKYRDENDIVQEGVLTF